MLDWFIWIKMIFDFIKRLFGLVDEGARKRRADELEHDHLTSFSSPKKRCCGLKGVHGGRPIYADENAETDIIYLGESHYSPNVSKERLNGTSCSKRKSASFQQPVQQSYPRNSISKMNDKESKSKRFSLKGMQAMSSPDCKYSTLTKTNLLREKQEYGQLLQNFLPQRIHVIRDKTEEDSKKRADAEVIDLEKFETPLKSTIGRGSCKSRELYFTPKASTPLKWFTPRESTNLESVRPKTKEQDISILGVRRQPIQQIKDEHSSIVSTKKITGGNIKTAIPQFKDEDSSNALTRLTTIEKSKSAIPRIKPIIIVEEVADDVEEIEPSTSKVSRNVEIVPTNSLRDNFAAKAVIKEDFIPRITGHYNERMEQHKKAAEELERFACLLSKHNRLTREAALETQLARSMRLCEAVLDETAAFEDEGLPTLTPPMLQAIKNALVPQPPNEVLVESFGLRITRKDIHTLAGLNWLNDEVINFYMNLLIARGNSGDGYPKVHAMNTFFYPKLLTGGHSSLKRWTRKIDVFAQDLLVVPIHLGIHWCMSIIDFRDKSIRYFDSMGGTNPKCLAALRQYLEDESMDKKKKPFDTNDWKLESMRNIPQQMNGSDCGVFSCMFAEFICADRKITFTQEDMPYFRKKMVYEILKAKLL